MKGEIIMRLNNKVVLVTASTRGIGLAIAKACADEGAIVCMAARDLEKAQTIADRMMNTTPNRTAATPTPIRIMFSARSIEPLGAT
jgi:NAD(P)-dependent dehydrogenase (short-subunit alcohol dehydrogenase family)